MNVASLGLRWWGLGHRAVAATGRPSERVDLSLRVACPHCTNVDTLSRHCHNARCGWVRCTCGALVFTARRHGHPRHGSGEDTCHDPVEAV